MESVSTSRRPYQRLYSDGGFNAPSQQQRPSPSSVARLPQEILDPRIASTVSGDIDSVQRRRRYNEEHDVLRRSKTGSLQGLKQLDNYQCRFWNPIWLDTRFLPPLAVLFAAMAIAVLLMLHFSAAKQGLVVQQQANHYGWTYGPTGALAVVTVFWSQVDFFNKSLLPWRELHDGPSTATKTLLLDYTSPIFPAMLLKAIRNGHWVIVISSVGLLLLKLTIVFSTGLLVLESTPINQNNVSIVLASRFDATHFELSNVDSQAGELVYGIHQEGLPFPHGTTGHLVVQTFTTPLDAARGSVVYADVEGLTIDLECELLPGLVPKRARQFQGVSQVNISTESCTMHHVTVAVAGANLGLSDITEEYQGMFQSLKCYNEIDSTLLSGSNTTAHAASAGHRILLSMAFLQWPNDVAHMEDIWLQNLSAVLCKPSLSIDTWSVGFTTDQDSDTDTMQAIRLKNGSRELPGFTAAHVGPAVDVCLENMEIGTDQADARLLPVPRFFQLISALNNGSTLKAFMDPMLMNELGSTIIKAVTAQIAHQYLLVPDDTRTTGSVASPKFRLHVKSLSAGLMSGLLGLLSCFTVLVIFMKPKDVIPHEPGSISALGAIIAASPGLKRALSGTGLQRGKDIRQHVSSMLFQSTLTPGPAIQCSIELLTTPGKGTHSLMDPLVVINWWEPMATKSWFRAITIALPLATVAALEICERISEQRTGLTDVDPKATANSHLLATYVPALVMITISGLYSSLESALTILAPYSGLWGNNATASKTITLNLRGKLPPPSFVLSAKSGNFGHCLGMLTVFVAAFLTIVVSGLYETAAVTVTRSLHLKQADTFDFTRTGFNVTDNDAAVTTSLVEYANLTYPEWTWEDLAFNSLQQLEDLTNSTTAAVSLTIPATRALLNCSVLPQPYLFTSGPPDAYIPSEVAVDVSAVRLPLECLREVPHSGPYYPYWDDGISIPSNGSSVYLGLASILSWSEAGVYGIDDPQDAPNNVTGNRVTGGYGCPTFGLMLGNVSAQSPTNGSYEWSVIGDVSVLLCYQNLQNVNAEVTLTLPDLAINVTKPPIPVESTSQPIKNPIDGSEIFEFDVLRLIYGLESPVNQSMNAAPMSKGGGNDQFAGLDAFTQALVLGKHGIPIEDLLGTDNIDRLILSVNKLYSTYMAQAISRNMRTTAPSVDLPVHEVPILNLSQQRLLQNRKSTIALQAMLGFLSACAATTYLTTRMSKVLPHNPCSIAGSATLLVDSDFSTREVFPEGSEWLSDSEFEKAGLFKGLLFRMGWLDEGDDDAERRNFGIHVYRDAAQVS